ncbi:MAG: hypothetical protein F6K65_28020 [Moorea sp. SIO3C2]|nr:hypothetical protein [Moorena sp. SIO3C2]
MSDCIKTGVGKEREVWEVWEVWGDGEMGSQMSNWRVPIFKNVRTYAKVLNLG